MRSNGAQALLNTDDAHGGAAAQGACRVASAVLLSTSLGQQSASTGGDDGRVLAAAWTPRTLKAAALAANGVAGCAQRWAGATRMLMRAAWLLGRACASIARFTLFSTGTQHKPGAAARQAGAHVMPGGAQLPSVKPFGAGVRGACADAFSAAPRTHAAQVLGWCEAHEAGLRPGACCSAAAPPLAAVDVVVGVVLAPQPLAALPAASGNAA